MEPGPQKPSDPLFDEAGSEYDPLSDFDAEDEDLEGSEGQIGPNKGYLVKAAHASKPDDRSVPHRIEALFVALEPRRRVLLEVLRFLDEPRRSDDLDRKVGELQENDLSVYSGYDYSTLLDEAGAIRRISEDGSEFDEGAEQMPDIVEIDGARFYKPTDGKQVFWQITDEGRSYLMADDPSGRLEALLAEEMQYQAVYKRVLEFCRIDEGRSAEELLGLIDNDPIVQSPRKYFSHFVKKLEDCGALSWSRKWKTTESGERGLATLFFDGGEPQRERETKAESGIDRPRGGGKL